ncbi:MAG: glycosyltransferase [Actinomycetota bacterium]|nr:glycosyltransferase [Actinomycetota bacterium]
MVVGSREARGRTVWASAVQPPYTGTGVFQREVYSRLADRGIQVMSSTEPRSRALRAIRSFIRVVGPPHAAALVTATPAPLVLRVPVVAVVYDLRWRRTRGYLSRLYRYLDLRRTVATSEHIFAISQRTRDEMLELIPSAEGRCTVLHPGPGIVSEADFAQGEAGAVLLAGKVEHKRNELVAEALAQAKPSWARRFLCVGVSDAAFQTLAQAFGREACERFDEVDDDLMRTIFRRAHVYVTASLEEGFGLPMVEALTAGCQVVAICQPLTLEVMGDAAILIDDGEAADIARQLQDPKWVAPEIRRSRASMFSWDQVAEAVSSALGRLARQPLT